MRRVLIIGDSNCLPRRDGKYRDSWVSLLKRAMAGDDLIVLADGSRTTEYLVLNPLVRPDGEIDYDPSSLEMFDPAIVILNLGIVDCAPRLFTRNESRVLSLLPAPLRKTAIATAKLLRGRTPRRVYVPRRAFENHVRQYLDRCAAVPVEKLIFIGIPTPDARCTRKNPAISHAVADYNAILARLAASRPWAVLVDPLHPEQEVSALYTEDGYHLSPRGHVIVYEAIARALGLPAAR
jgi:acyl-CoA thioesterase I